MNIEDLKRRSLAIYPGMVTFNQTTGKTEHINITLSDEDISKVVRKV